MSHLQYAARAFGLDPDVDLRPPEPARLPLPNPGECIAVTGPSGAGKTLALRALMQTHGARELPPLDDRPVLELFDPHLCSQSVLRNLARVGLADGRLWRLRAPCLSAGERRRLQLALALCGPAKLLVIDEFEAHLDAVTARVIARNLRRVAARERLQLVVSTHRPETLGDLQPARVIHIDNGVAREAAPPAPRELADEVEIVRGRARDYDAFARWHYLGPGRPGPVSDVFVARHEGRAIGIALFGYPHLLLSARTGALPEFAPRRIRETGAGALNANVRLLQRVVVEPRFRGIGVAGRLVRHGLHECGAPVVECVAQMGAFSDFLLTAGFEHVCDVQPPASVRRLTAFLRRHGINVIELLDGKLREGLTPEVASRLERHIANVARTRLQTGFGSRRGGGGLPEDALRKALARVGASPGYFLWKRDET